jgi:hypothetical protein
MDRFGELVCPLIYPHEDYVMDSETAASIGWKKCKEEVLRILKTPKQNLDLSLEEVDKRFIEDIENL